MCLMEKLTFQEEEIMLIIWQVKEGVIKDFLKIINYFENSYKEMVTFFARKQKISAKELEEIIRLIEKE